MFIPLSILGGLTSAVPAAYQLFTGMKQQAQAGIGLSRLKRPEYKTPEEALRAMNISQNRYADKFMPGQGAYMDRVEQQAANAFAQSSEAGNPFALIANIQGQAANQLRDINTQAVNQQMANEKAYQQSLGQIADYRDQEWQINKFAPYRDKYNEFRDMYGAARQNIYGGLDSLAGIGTSLIGGLMGGMGKKGVNVGRGGAGGGGGMGSSLMSGGQKKYSFNSADAAKALREFEMKQAGYNPNLPFDAPNLYDLGKSKEVFGPGSILTPNTGYGKTEPDLSPLIFSILSGTPY
jgi:hypothetical protein